MAGALEQFVINVRTLSSQGNFSQLCEHLNKSMETLMKNVTHLDNVLETLDLQQHSLGVLAILCAKFSSSGIQDYEPLFAQFQEFVLSCNMEQVRYAKDAYAELCHMYTQALVKEKVAIRGVDLLCQAITKIQMHPAQLTPVHADLCLLCLFSKCFKPALQFLDTDIQDISKEGSGFQNKGEHYDARYFLLYFYYGGMIYTGLKNYERALFFFEICITTPAMAVSLIMLEAYKKFILVSLILHGKILCVPKYTSQVVSRYMKPLCQIYHELASSYGTNNPDHVRAVITKHQAHFTRQQDLGLVKQVLASLYKKNIQRLTKTFLTLSLTDMANRVQLSSPEEAERYVLNMIEDGEIFATINHKDGMVVFHDNPEQYNSPQMLSKLEDEMTTCMALTRQVQLLEEAIMLNPQFVQKSSGSHDDDVPGTSSAGTSKFPSMTM